MSQHTRCRYCGEMVSKYDEEHRCDLGVTHLKRYADKFDRSPNQIDRDAGRVLRELIKRAESGDLELAFENVFDAYNTPADRFLDDHALAVYMRKRITKAFELLQYVTGRRTK